MGLRTGRGTLDPRYFRHATPVFEGDMTALIEIRHPFKGDEEPLWDSELAEWVYPEDLAPVWRGLARVQPNKDWRARNREWAMENTAEHAVRIQLNAYKNFLVPKDEWPAPPVDILHGHVITVLNNPNDPVLENFVFTVRNPIGATDNWHRTILCDANLGSRTSGD